MSALRFALAALLAFWLALSASFALDPAVIGQAERTVQSLRAELTRITGELRNPSLNEEQLSKQRSDLETARAAALDQSQKLNGPLAEVRQQLTSLGPAPTDGKTEPEGVAEARSQLQGDLDRLQSVKSQFDVIAVEAEQQAGRISALQRDQFFQRVFQSSQSIVNPALWIDIGKGIGTLVSRISVLLANWWADVAKTANALWLVLIPLFLLVFVAGYTAIHRWFTRWTAQSATPGRMPDDIGRLWRIVRGQITTVVLLFILVIPIALALEAGGYKTPRFDLIYDTIVKTLFGTAVYYMFARRIAAPGHPEWRVIDVDDRAASKLPVLAGLTAFFSIAHRNLLELANALFLPVSYTIGQSAVSALAMLVLLSLIVLVLRGQDGLPDPAGRRIYFRWLAPLTPLIWLAIAIGFGALLLGYLSLASFIAQQVFRTGMLIAALFLLHHLTDAAVAASFDPQSGFGRFTRRVTGLGERAIERLGILFRILVDFMLVIAGLPLLFLLWTVTWVDFGSLFNTAVFGVQIGEITISPWSITMLLLILAGGILLTKLLIGWLDRRILSETRIDKGVQDSIRKGATYAGYIVAGGFALTAAGLDFSNLAIIAGALGVGIGFGLQSIFNNFISGLILLAERPIRVGDWIALPVGEGLVKRINVRSTEIETFDSCTIIVPNTNLIIEPVRNWTHKDTMGRVVIAVTADYSSDPEAVKDILLALARDHEKVLTYPEPTVGLVRFGATGLDFELRCFVSDIFIGGAVASEIRFALLKVFREKGITIPHPLAVMQGPQK